MNVRHNLSSFRRFFRFSAALFSILALSAQWVGAAEPTVVSQMSLTKGHGSEVTLDSLTVTFMSDDTVNFTGSASYAADKPVMGYRVSVDTITGEYFTELLEKHELRTIMEGQPPTSSVKFQNPDALQTLGVNLPNTSRVDTESPLANLQLLALKGKVTVLTEDIIQINLTYITNELHWLTDGRNVAWTFFEDTWWAGNPTLAGTNWFIDAIDFSTPTPLGPTAVTNSMSGQFHNDNFLGGVVGRTITNSSSRLTALNNGFFAYNWDTNSTGNVGFAVLGTVLLNDFNNNL